MSTTPSVGTPVSQLPIATTVGPKDRVVVLRPDEPLDQNKLATTPASLLTGETAALVAVDAVTPALVYEAPKGLSQASLDGLSLGITTAPGTATVLPTTAHLDMNSLGTGTTYDSATGWLYLVLPSSILPSDILSVHLYRTIAGQEHVLAANQYPFGGGGSTLPTRNIDEVPTAKALAVIAANVPAFEETDLGYDGKSFFDDRNPSGIIFYTCRKSRPATTGAAQKLKWYRIPVL